MKLTLSSAVVAAALSVGVPAADAAPCSDLIHPVYGIGGSASKPFLAKLSKGLNGLTGANQATIVYQAPGACLGVYGLVDGTLLTGTASYWLSDGVERTCDLPAGGQAIDFANMANSAALCSQAPSPLPGDIGDFEGSVNTVNFIVPVASGQVSISAAAAYFILGFGAAGLASPWINEAEVIIRDANSAVQQLIGLAINVSADRFIGVNGTNQNGVITRVATAPDPEAAIGIVSGEAADANRATVRTLAYQHYGQTCGFLPDSTSTAFDKKNVRDGHYFLWTPQHFFAKVDTTTHEIVNADARKLIGYITRDVAAPTGLDVLRTEIESGTVPRCAMSVWREGDLGDVSVYQPPADEACSCFFDSLTGGTSCDVCDETTPCTGGGSCNFGYCEVAP